MYPGRVAVFPHRYAGIFTFQMNHNNDPPVDLGDC